MAFVKESSLPPMVKLGNGQTADGRPDTDSKKLPQVEQVFGRLMKIREGEFGPLYDVLTEDGLVCIAAPARLAKDVNTNAIGYAVQFRFEGWGVVKKTKQPFRMIDFLVDRTDYQDPAEIGDTSFPPAA